MNLLDMINGAILGALGCDMTTFVRYFPAAETMYSIFVGLGLGILLLNFVWQLFRNFGIGIGLEAEDPLQLTFRTILFMGLVFFSRDIVDLALDIGGTPYQWIVDASLPPIQFASFMSVATTVVGSIVSGSVLLISLVLLIILAWNYIKLLFEAAERYILLGVLVFTAPVAFALGGAQSTSNIFKSWCRMLGGQLFLLLMNAWCLKLFTNMFGEFIANPLGTGDGGNLFIWFLCAIAFLKVSQKIDSFMASLGISVGHTGGSMLGEALIIARSLGGFKKGGIGSFGSNKSGVSGSTSGADGALSGGLAGIISQKAAAGAASNLTSEKGSSSGFFSGLGGKMYESSAGEEGGFASRVIGGIATGTAAQNGVISGEKAADAFQAYMGPMGGIPISNEAEDGSGMQPTLTPTEGIPTSPETAEDGMDTGAPMAGGDVFGESSIPMSMSEDESPAIPLSSEESAHLESGSEAFSDIPYHQGGAETAGSVDDSADFAIDSSFAEQAASIPVHGVSETTSEAAAKPISVAPEGPNADISYTASTPGSEASIPISGGAAPRQIDASAESGTSAGTQASAFANQYAGQNTGSLYAEPPTFRNIEMGSGRITGLETSPQHPTGIQFAMYHAGQYNQPDGKFTTVTSRDGEKWYKQYAVPTVDRTPTGIEVDQKSQRGKAVYDEKIVQKLPKAPSRRDR